MSFHKYGHIFLLLNKQNVKIKDRTEKLLNGMGTDFHIRWQKIKNQEISIIKMIWEIAKNRERMFTETGGNHQEWKNVTSSKSWLLNKLWMRLVITHKNIRPVCKHNGIVYNFKTTFLT